MPHSASEPRPKPDPAPPQKPKPGKPTADAPPRIPFPDWAAI